jgi:penicillin G amidase
LIQVRSLQKLDIDPVWLLRIFTLIPAVLVILAGAGAIWIYLFVLSLLPDTKAQIDLGGLSGEVRVVRDSYGVPAIMGDKSEDVATVFGYVMAQDRLWQMDYLRRAGQGRLAEILGPDYLDSDHFIRILKTGRKPDKPSDPREQKWLEQFVAGINRYMALHSKKLPVEFSLLEYRPEPFSTEDIDSILVALAIESSPAFKVDPLVTQITAKLGKEAAGRLLPRSPSAPEPLIVSDLIGLDLKGPLFSKNAGSIAGYPALKGGCAWSVGQTQSRSGRAMSACAIYQSLTAPGFWYKASLQSQDLHLSGAFIPGAPIALAGSNDKISWGCAPAPADDADLFLDVIDSDSPKAYWKTDRWKKLERRQETYLIKGGSQATKDILLSETGPLVSAGAKNRAVSLRWVGREGSNLLSALFKLNRAHKAGEVKDSLRSLISPCLNVVWACEDGSFGSQLAGRVPIRAPESDGITPMPAWTGAHDWRGFIPFNDLPSKKNTQAGYAVVTDSCPGGNDFPVFMGSYWSDDSKTDRIGYMLGQTQEHSKESFQKIQNDSMSTTAKDIVPELLKSIRTGGTAPQEEAAKILSSWDYQMNRESPGAAVFGLVYQALVEELFLSRLGEELFNRFAANHSFNVMAIRKLALQKDMTPAEKQALFARSFQKAVERGATLMGAEPGKWKWGAIHETEFRHPIAAKSRFLEGVYDVGPISLSGAWDTVNFSGWSFAGPFKTVEGVSLREINDMTEPPQGFGITYMGSSAHFFSSHYKDITAPWLAGRMHRDPGFANDPGKDGANSVLFKPASGKASLKSAENR